MCFSGHEVHTNIWWGCRRCHDSDRLCSVCGVIYNKRVVTYQGSQTLPSSRVSSRCVPQSRLSTRERTNWSGRRMRRSRRVCKQRVESKIYKKRKRKVDTEMKEGDRSANAPGRRVGEQDVVAQREGYQKVRKLDHVMRLGRVAGTK